jgi:hypothetical protein
VIDSNIPQQRSTMSLNLKKFGQLAQTKTKLDDKAFKRVRSWALGAGIAASVVLLGSGIAVAQVAAAAKKVDAANNNDNAVGIRSRATLVATTDIVLGVATAAVTCAIIATYVL